jgi:hypothetical protein
MRINCTLPGRESFFVEVSERWTRGEIRTFWGASVGISAEEAGALLVAKTEAVYLETAAGLVLDSPDDLTDENIDALDYELSVWLSTAYGHAVNELQALTKKNVRSSLGITEAKA